MSRRFVLGPAIALAAITPLPGYSGAEGRSLKEQLVGSKF
jgi:hypothetical protein